MWKKKILNKILSLKEKTDNYFNNAKVITIYDLEKQLIKENLLTQSFDDYIKKKRNTKTMIYSLIDCIICLIGGIRLLIGAFAEDPQVLTLIVDPLYLIGNRFLISITIAVIFSTVYYLKLRFQQITKQIERISAKNLSSFNGLIIAHNRVALITKDCDIFFSHFCFGLFLCAIWSQFYALYSNLWKFVDLYAILIHNRCFVHNYWLIFNNLYSSSGID
jgi:hypothetical protein